MQNMNASIEDDIYYIPHEKPLMVKEVENITGQKINMTAPAGVNNSPDNHPKNGSALVINRQKGTTEYVSTSALAAQADDILNDPYAPENTMLYTNSGYWIGGFNGSDRDLEEAARIINRYPEGFGFISNGQDIALNLSFSPDWNVYTDNGRYWWFPSPSNIRLYNTFLFGSYPKYIWTVVWNEPFYDSWAFDSQFSWGWSSPGWHFGFGWNTGIYRPRYSYWYGGYPYWGSWYDPWWGYNRYPVWHHPHWHLSHQHHPNWNGFHPEGTPSSASRPRPGNLRPNYGSGSIGQYPDPNRRGNGARPNYNNQRQIGSVRPGTESSRPTNNAGSQATSSRPTNSNSRPATTQSGSNGNTNRYTRPTTQQNTSTNKSNNVKNYNRQPNSYRPNYNNSRSYYQNNNSSRSSYTAPSSSRSGTTPIRSTARSGGRR